jgi:hypothetical protein
MKIDFILISIASLGVAMAQPTVAPTNEPTGPVRGKTVFDDYNVTQYFEAGYRFRTVDGNEGKYRSDVNFGNGIRLLSSQFSMHSKLGHGKYFDELVVTTQGLGNDPYESASLRIQKNKLYRYDMIWRSNDYFNPALTISNGQHLMDTSHKLQDHDFTLLPQSKIKFFLGYSGNTQTGPAISTTQQFDSRGDEFPLFENIRRTRHDYRIGNETEFFGLKLNWMHGWEYFKEDSAYSSKGLNVGNNIADQTTLTSLNRVEPVHGSTPYWRVNLISDRQRWYAINGRFTHSGGRNNFVFDQTATGTDRFGNGANRQVILFGNARRPVTTGNFTVSIFASSKWTFSNHTAVTNTKMEGDSSYREINNATLGDVLLNFQYLGIRTISNLSDVTFRPAKFIQLNGGYSYSSRLIRSVQDFDTPPLTLPAANEQTNTTNSGRFGLRLTPAKRLRVSLDGELARSDKPIYTTSDRNYHGLGARVQWKAKNLTLSAAARSSYNTNSSNLFVYSSRGRNYSFDGSYNARTWLSLDAGYSKMHLDTMSGIAYFALLSGRNPSFVQGDSSLYRSNIHAVNIGARASIRKRADLFFGYNRVQDLGDGRATAAAGPQVATVQAFLIAQTFPLSYQSPLVRLSLRLHERLRWNFGYQYYDYAEKFLALQNYQANTGYTSLTWSF